MPDRRDPLPLFYGFRSSLPPGMIRLDSRRLAFFVIMLALLSLSSALYLRQASVAASYGSQIRKLEEKREWTHREIVSLRGQVAEQDALQRSLDVGAELGYVLPDVADQTRRLRLEYQVAEPSSPDMASLAEGQPLPGAGDQATEEQAESVFQRLVRQFEVWISGEEEPKAQ